VLPGNLDSAVPYFGLKMNGVHRFASRLVHILECHHSGTLRLASHRNSIAHTRLVVKRIS
jgi:hypothetical protein